MLTRDYLLKIGFEHDTCSPTTEEDYFKKENPNGGYISVRFKPNKETAVGLYAYSEKEHINIRKVVLSDTNVTIRDFEIAKEICNL